MTPAPYNTPRPCVRGCLTKARHAASCGSGDCGCCCHANPAFPPPCDVPGGCAHTTDPTCTGCDPRLALPGGMVCAQCWERTIAALDGAEADPLAGRPAVTGLLDLYEDLLTPTRVAFAGRVSGSSEARLVLADGPRWSREWIRMMLLEWRHILARPVEPSKAQRDAHAHAVNVGEQPDPLPTAPYGRGLSAPSSSDPHDTIRAVTRHAEWLLASAEHADQFCYDVLACHADATRTAYPTAPAGVLLGRCPLPVDDAGTPCGGLVRSKGDTAVVTCPACGYSGQPHEWRRLMLARPGQPHPEDPTAGVDAVATGRAIAAWLSAQYGREIKPSTVWQWSCRGTRHGTLPRAGQNPQGQTLYVIAVAEAIAAALYAPESAPTPAPEETQ